MSRRELDIKVGEVDPDDLTGELVDGSALSLYPGERRKDLAGETLYLAGCPWEAIERSLGPMDRIYAGRYGRIEAKLWTGSGMMSVVDGFDAWGLDPCSAPHLAEQLGDAADALAELGLPMAGSAAAVAARALRSGAADGSWPMRQLRPQWRALAHEACHPGPIAVVSGGGHAPVVEVDRVAAFLRGLEAPLPVPGTWTPFGPWDRWERIRQHPGDGFVRAVVMSRGRTDAPSWRSLGPLPIRMGRATCWPVGQVAGTWTIGQLREAEELGVVDIEAIIEGATCRTEPLLRLLADQLWRLRERLRWLARGIYTRTWGVCCSLGRWEGLPEDRDSERDESLPREYRNNSGLVWAAIGHGKQAHNPHCPPTYRPDWGAFIAAHNCRAMVQATQAAAGRLVAAHLDCMALDADAEGMALARRLVDSGEWHIKAGPAPGRWWGPGVAAHDGRLLHSGLPEPIDAEHLAEMAPFRAGDSYPGQVWTLDGPTRHATAAAKPRWLRLPRHWWGRLQTGQVLGGWDGEAARASVWSPRWTLNGWWREERLPGEIADERLRPDGWESPHLGWGR